MTDARIPERYLLDRRVARLSDAAFRAWVTATLWSVANRTDGRVDAADVPLVPGLNTDAADALVAAGLWSASDDGWIIEGFEDEQTSRSELQALDDARRHARERKRAQRERERTAPAEPRSRDRHVTSHGMSRETTQARTGQAPGVGSALVDGWGDAPPPASCSRHPNGTDAPCGACGRARVAREEWEAAEARRPEPPRPHKHAWAGDGTCFRPDSDGQPCLARREAGSA